MGELHERFVEPPRQCDYLADRKASLEYRVMTDVTPEELGSLLARGWRRLGPFYFRPACAGCFECVPLRIPSTAFTATASQKRARRRLGRFRITVGRPVIDSPRLDLYRRWHAARERVRGWEPSPLGEEEYFLQFAYPHPAVRELTVWEGTRPLAVGIWDWTPAALSAVYFFYDPDLARLSPGVGNVMVGVELARARGIPYVYLGYRVAGCPSMHYKASFRPHEILLDRPGDADEPAWRPAEPSRSPS
jgi:arginine-tRNA-protein transferase